MCALCDGRPEGCQTRAGDGTVRVAEVGSAAPAYLSIAKHRHRSSHPTANKWARWITPDKERRIYSVSRSKKWTDEDGHHWGVCENLPVLGLENRHRYAKFPQVTAIHACAHGYPVSALDRRREIEHKPPREIVCQWRDQGIISKREANLIMRGKI